MAVTDTTHPIQLKETSGSAMPTIRMQVEHMQPVIPLSRLLAQASRPGIGIHEACQLDVVGALSTALNQGVSRVNEATLRY